MLSYVQDATIDFAQQILENANNRVGVVSYSNSASLDQALTNDLTDVENAINGLTAREHQYTNIAAGFNTAANHMSSAGRDPATTARAIVLMSDGVANRRVGGSCTTWPTSPTTCTQAAITAGVAAQSQAMVFTVGLFGNLQASHPGCVPVARATLQQAQNGGYWETFEAVDVGPIYDAIAGQVVPVATNVVVTDVVSEEFEIDTNSFVASQGVASAIDNTITWTVGAIGTTAVTLTYQVTAKAAYSGDFAVNDSTTMSYTDVDGNPGSSPTFPNPIVSVSPALTANISPRDAVVGLGIGVPLDGSPSGGCGEYTHSWTGTGASYLSGTDIVNPTFTSNTAGTYSLTYTVTDSCDCKASDSTTVTVSVGPVATTLELAPEAATNILPDDQTEEFTVTVKDQSGIGMSEQVVSLETNFGILSTDPVTTGGGGTATFTITSAELGNATITATLGYLSDTSTKEWTYTPVATTLKLTPEAATNILPDDQTEEFTVTVKDQLGIGMSEQVVSLETTFGNLSTDSVTTGESGTATFTISSSLPGTATITTTLGSLSDTSTKEWTYTPVATTLELTPESATNTLPVETDHEFTVTVLDQYNSPMSDQEVTLSADFGSLPPSVTTGENGTATFIISSSLPGTANITASLGDLSDTATKTWTYTPTATTLELEPAEATNVVGTNHTLTATVTDQYGNPVLGQAVSWTIDSGPGSFVSSETTTDANGEAEAVITSTEVGTTTVKASVSEAIYDTATKTWTAGALDHFVFSPVSNQTAGVAFSITITAVDQYGNTVTSFTGTVTLSDLSGSISPDTTGNFDAGVWTGNVTITTAYTADTITATVSPITAAASTVTATASTITGTSNEFDVSAGGGGGGGGGGGPIQYFTVDFLGKITKVPMGSDGRLLTPLKAPSPDGTHLFEMARWTKTLDAKTNIVTLIEIREAGATPLPANTVIVGNAYDFEPSNITFSNTTFNQPVWLTLGYDVNNLPEGVTSVTLAYYTAETGWTELEPKTEGGVVAGVGKLTVPLDHFTIFAILAKVTPPPTPPVSSPPPPTPAAPTPAPTPAPAPTPPSPAPTNWGLIGGLIGAAIVVIGLLVYWYYRRRQQGT